MINKSFKIIDMHCSMCVMRLEGLEDSLIGIKKISGSYLKQQLEIQFDETKLTEPEIITAIEKLGYKVSQNP